MSGSTDRVVMARALAALFGAGATLVWITLVLPHHEDEAQLELLIPVALAYLTAGALLAAPRRFSPAVLLVVLAFGTTLVGLCVIWGGPAGSVYAFMYVWVALYVAAFFTVRETLAELAWAFATYVAVIEISGDVEPPGAQWLMVAGTSAMVAALVLALTRQLRAQQRDQAAVTRIANTIGGAGEVSSASVADELCASLLESVDATFVDLLVETAEADGLHVLGSAGGGGDPFATNDGVVVLDVAYASGEPHRLRGAEEDGGVTGIVVPVRRDGHVAGLLAVAWARPRRMLDQRTESAVALFAAEAGVALERMAHPDRERERRALELNDAIVQGLVVAKYALREGRVEIGEQMLDETLDRAKALVDSQLQELHGTRAPEPGSLRVGDPDAESR
jgi:GAF domain-containing protein